MGDRRVTLCRELTKKFETVMPTTLEEALAYYERPSKQKRLVGSPERVRAVIHADAPGRDVTGIPSS